MWQAPYRPRESEISQSYNDGLVDIYSQHDTAAPGYLPKVQLQKVGTLAFEEQRVGIQRYYSGKQNQIQIEKVLRVPRGFLVTNQMVARIRGQKLQYYIEQVQKVPDIYPPSLDLSLKKVAQVLKVEGEDEP